MMRIGLILLGVFVLALSVVIGARMSADAMDVVVGVVCGIGASIPTMLMMLFLFSQRQEADILPPQADERAEEPSIMIIIDKLLITTTEADWLGFNPPGVIVRRHLPELMARIGRGGLIEE